MFRTDLLSITRSPNTVFAAIGICHAVMLTASDFLTSLVVFKKVAPRGEVEVRLHPHSPDRSLRYVRCST